jgi:hypothetical protein
MRQAERDLALQAQPAMRDRQATEAGASATPGRAKQSVVHCRQRRHHGAD